MSRHAPRRARASRATQRRGEHRRRWHRRRRHRPPSARARAVSSAPRACAASGFAHRQSTPSARTSAFLGASNALVRRERYSLSTSTSRERGSLVVVAGRKKLRGLVKKVGDAAEAALLESTRLRGERSIIGGELREIREGRGEVYEDEPTVREVLGELRALTTELRELKEELRAALRGGELSGASMRNDLVGAVTKELTSGTSSTPTPKVKSDDEMLAMLSGGALAGMGEPEFEPVLDVTAWRGDGTDRSSEWPFVTKGEDDIYLMTTIHAKLNDAGFWAGEEDEEDMFFGSSTKDALLYFQANAGVQETGVVDAETWSALLGAEAFMWGPPPGAIAFDETKFSSQMEARGTQQPNAAAASATPNPKHFMADEDYAPDDYDPFSDDDDRSSSQGPSFTLGTTDGKQNAHKWPILREEDGGMEVHKMQIALSEKGYDSGEEDMEYWFFGFTTQAALLAFQATERLPESGSTDIATWRALLGDELLELSPEVALSRIGDGAYPHDLSRTDKVFLLGEQRYEE
mmetsp:Transcript_800/g.3021  ORF Transcript_800/g.3021 Transcript_800/m.3021 type:complete len:521 (-) Transcript_800:62-1624(-)